MGKWSSWKIQNSPCLHLTRWEGGSMESAYVLSAIYFWRSLQDSAARGSREHLVTIPPAASPGRCTPLLGPASHLPALGWCFGYPGESQMALPASGWATQSHPLIHSLTRDGRKDNAGKSFLQIFFATSQAKGSLLHKMGGTKLRWRLSTDQTPKKHTTLNEVLPQISSHTSVISLKAA